MPFNLPEDVLTIPEYGIRLKNGTVSRAVLLGVIKIKSKPQERKHVMIFSLILGLSPQKVSYFTITLSVLTQVTY